ncbi:MAG: hypothetical protein KA368_07660 [Acidobacteria bacterium]|nr:hypothetical protein [Acidobacteriota bacterium]
MEFDWADYKTLAYQLRQQSDDAAKRSAISRVYYSVYHKAQNYLKEKHDFQVSRMGEGSHKRVWDGFRGKGRTFTAVAEKGIELKENRQKADYDPAIIRLDDLLDESFIVAERLLEYLGKLP